MPELADRTLDVVPDAPDFRDLAYVPALVTVPPQRPLDEFASLRLPVLDQGREGACTGFALATVANFLLAQRDGKLDRPVSPAMLYAMARRYDEWPGEAYDGSSARGAMKGWHKHGVCADAEWPASQPAGRLDPARAVDALQRPLGAYFRVDHTDLVAMHAALGEVGVLFAACLVHAGWDDASGGAIVPGGAVVGAHAFAIVGYGQEGFWIRNSWGPGWGDGGHALLAYDDWLANGRDVWVARLGVPVAVDRDAQVETEGRAVALEGSGLVGRRVRRHVVSLGNDGRFQTQGQFATDEQDVDRFIRQEFPAVTAAWPRKRLLVMAHGGLVTERSAVTRVARDLDTMLARQVYPLALSWRTDVLSTVSNIVRDALARRRTAGVLDVVQDFMAERLDDAIEPVARLAGGKALWDEMKENAGLASAAGGGLVMVADRVKAVVDTDPSVEVHLTGHSAGSILLGPFLGLLRERGVQIATCTLWAPACTIAFFGQHYAPAIRSGAVGRFGLYLLDDATERDDDVGGLYRKSVLYLVSNAFEQHARIPLIRDGEPLLGMARFALDPATGVLAALAAAPGGAAGAVVVAPRTHPQPDQASGATSHAAFSGDPATFAGLLARVTRPVPAPPSGSAPAPASPPGSAPAAAPAPSAGPLPAPGAAPQPGPLPPPARTAAVPPVRPAGTAAVPPVPPARAGTVPRPPPARPR